MTPAGWKMTVILYTLIVHCVHYAHTHHIQPISLSEVVVYVLPIEPECSVIDSWARGTVPETTNTSQSTPSSPNPPLDQDLHNPVCVIIICLHPIQYVS